MERKARAPYATVNPCRLCAPLGAALAFKGIEQSLPLLHGSQGCATYIRRYTISHFREPIDIASSSFNEDTAVFGGGENFKKAVENIIRQYHPKLIGVATTCLAETIGDDLSAHIRDFISRTPVEGRPIVIQVSTPAYAGSHAEGFRNAIDAIVKGLAGKSGNVAQVVNVIPGMWSPADLRWLDAAVRSFELDPLIVPDWSETLDGGIWDEFQVIPQGGASLGKMANMGNSIATIDMGGTAHTSPGAFLSEKFGVENRILPLPLGVEATDRFLEALSAIAEAPVPINQILTRARLIDAYIDGHKYVSGKRVALCGDPDIVVALNSFCGEIGIEPVLVATGGAKGSISRIAEAWGGSLPKEVIQEDTDFDLLWEEIENARPEMIIGNSKGYQIARRLGVPLIRTGFPIHDRFGGARLQICGYDGTLALFDRIVNALLEKKQDNSPDGYAYL